MKKLKKWKQKKKKNYLLVLEGGNNGKKKLITELINPAIQQKRRASRKRGKSWLISID